MYTNCMQPNSAQQEKLDLNIAIIVMNQKGSDCDDRNSQQSD